MKSDQSSGTVVLPRVGDIWKELDPRVEYQRYVKVSAVESDRVRIHGVEQDKNRKWVARGRAPERWAQLKRFNGKRGGYSFHRRTTIT
jgi:hypothetical protein